MQLEILALHHQVAVYQRSVPRPRIQPTDRLLWTWLARLWAGWQNALAFVQPRTVIAWQQKRFREHWRRLSQGTKSGRPIVGKDIQALIKHMSQANPTWGSPRIVGELRKLGIDVAKSTVEKYQVRPQRPSSPTWKTFLNNHVKDLVSLDFFVVPTVTYKVLFVLVILAHERRQVIHCEEDESVPLLEWLDHLPPKTQAKCLARLKRLEDLEHELRRPEAEYLRDGIHELRASLGGVHYRILYFVHGNIAAVISHGITKEQRVPPREIERAIARKTKFTTNPTRYNFRPELSYGRKKAVQIRRAPVCVSPLHRR